jgi:hypothetical protein
MKTVTTNLYAFSELSDTARQYAIERERESRQSHGTPWTEETIDSLRKALDLFGCSAIWTVGSSHTSVRNIGLPSLDEDCTPLSFVVDALRGIGCTIDGDTPTFPGDCKLTGYCADEDLLQAFYESVLEAGNKYDPESILRDAVRDMIYKAGDILEAEEEHYMSDEDIVEHLECLGEIFACTGNRID